MRTSSPRVVHTVLAVLATAGLGLARPASAQGIPTASPARPGARFEVDARLGVALPTGDLANAVGANDNVKLQVPLGVGAGFHWPSGWYLGAYFSYGFLSMKKASVACPAGWTGCGGHDVRVGVETLYHLRSRKSVDPWFGFGFGYEWLTYHASLAQSSGDLHDSVTLGGYEYLSLELGLDLAVEKALTIGPFATFTFATFGDLTADRTGAATSSTSQSLSSSMHTWVFLGVRGSFSFL